MLLLIGASVAGWALSTIHPANLGVTRIVGAPYIISADFVRNQFLVRIVNKQNGPAEFLLHLEHAPAGLRQTGLVGPIRVEALGEIVQPLVFQQLRADYHGPFLFTIGIADPAGTFHLERQVEFLGPDVRLLREEEEEKKKHHETRH